MANVVAPQAPFTVTDAMVLCGVPNQTLFNGSTNAQRIAEDVFDDDFQSTMDKTFQELEDDFKSYSSMTVNQGQIRLNPGTKKKVKAFIQWGRDMIRCGIDPASMAFPVWDTAGLIRKYKSHEAFVVKSKTITTTAKPDVFTEKAKWEEWNPIFLNFLRAIPGRDGIPLKYIVRDNEQPTRVYGIDFIDDYVNRAPLNGEAFNNDAQEVSTYITNFMSGNQVAESKLLAHADEHNGRLDYIALKEHYEGVGINAVEILKADKVIATLHYNGEKKPHMWWDEFERQLTKAFAMYDRKERREVYSDEMKLRTLCTKGQADFLQATRTSIMIDLSRVPVTMTYAQALSNFRNEVNRKFPPGMSNNRNTRRLNETSRGRGRGRGRGRDGRGRGRNNGRGGRGGRHGGRHSGYRRDHEQTPLQSHTIYGNDGSEIQVHPAYQFSSAVWANIPRNEQERIRNECNEHRNVRQMTSYNQGYGGYNNNAPTNNDRSVVSEITTGRGDNNDQNTQNSSSGSIMGGRNEQASIRQRNPNNNN